MLVTVFGGTGFLGSRVTRQLLGNGHSVRVAVRRPDRLRPLGPHEAMLSAVEADIRDTVSVENAVDGARAVINAVSLYVEKGDATFDAIHVKGAANVASAVRRIGADRLIHVSGVGADVKSPSLYIRKRGEGERAVREALPFADILRPCVMFGRDDSFINRIVGLARTLPIIPLFGNGRTRLQPVHVVDVARAAASCLDSETRAPEIYELGGPDIRDYRELIEAVMRSIGRRRWLVPVPFAIWDSIAAAANMLPEPPLTEGQVALLKRDNIASPDHPGLSALGVTPVGRAAFLDGEVQEPALCGSVRKLGG